MAQKRAVSEIPRQPEARTLVAAVATTGNFIELARADDATTPWAGSILCCASRDQLVRMLRAGEPGALECAVMALPATLPLATRLVMRDSAIRRVAAKLRASFRDSDHHVAQIIEVASDTLSEGRVLRSIADLDAVDSDELKAIETDIKAALAWTDKPGRLPRKRQLLNII